MNKDVRRVITGHTNQCRSFVARDAPAPAVPLGNYGVVFHEVWATQATPAPIEPVVDHSDVEGVSLLPSKGGTRLRILDFPPERPDAPPVTAEVARAAFAAIGAPEASRFEGEGSRHPFMHRTETVDYGIVLEGRITLVLEDGEAELEAGDIVVQRGTNHAWANRSGAPCRMAFILIDGEYRGVLAAPRS